MAIFHLSIKTVSRSTGRSAVGAAAYRCGQRLTNERDGVTHDYRARTGVEHSEVILPENAPVWMADRAALWNAAEAAENRKDSKTAREYELALPHELDALQRQELAREFGQHLAENFGVAVGVSIHAPHPKIGEGPEIDAPGGDPRNFHAHVLTTTRRVTPEGLGEKTRELDVKQTSADLVEQLRQEWATMSNRALAQSGVVARVDHRSYQRQGREIEPTTHIGKEAIKLARQGVDLDRVINWRRSRDRKNESVKTYQKRKVINDNRIPQSTVEAVEKARNQHRVARDNHNGLRNVSQLSLASDTSGRRGGILHGHASSHLGGRNTGDRVLLQRQSRAVSSARSRDLDWLRRRIEWLQHVKKETETKSRQVWKCPDGVERDLFIQRLDAYGRQINVKNEFTAKDARAHIQKDWPAAVEKWREAAHRLDEIRERGKELGLWGRVFSKWGVEFIHAKEMLEREAKVLDRLDKRWASPKAQKWADDLLEKASNRHDTAVSRVLAAQARLEGVNDELSDCQQILEVLEANPDFKPTLSNQNETPEGRIAALKTQVEEIEEAHELRLEHEAKVAAEAAGLPEPIPDQPGQQHYRSAPSPGRRR